MKSNTLNDWILAERLASVREQYLEDHDPLDPLASPLYGDPAGLPPIMIQAGTHELLLDDIRAFVTKTKSQDGTVDYTEWEGMFHCGQIFASDIPQGREAISAAGDFARQIWE